MYDKSAFVIMTKVWCDESSIIHLIVYRGQIMSTEELNKIKDNPGIHISMNSFMSTSKNINVALAFISNIENTDEWKPVLSEIIIDLNLKTIIFADINKLSIMKDEQEILFSLSTIFEILSIIYDEQLKV
ncbi:unnamed protein product [Didymodactylos carnosus]|uniref:Uncharacterized protein n=1 Tax=Didymodactylos carnosus TaxID=1234261 RepID=A0A8S2GFT4_9BILA|nr:unnamed protein product [Didymodactylos carnosus]CAF4568006.1 unnamed protein product [Didymodactylos carnosus]